MTEKGKPWPKARAIILLRTSERTSRHIRLENRKELFKKRNTQKDHDDNHEQRNIVLAHLLKVVTGDGLVQHVITTLQYPHSFPMREEVRMQSGR